MTRTLGCAVRETFLTPKNLSAELQPASVERTADVEDNAGVTPRNTVRLASSQTDNEGPLVLPSPTPPPFIIVSGEVRKPGEFTFPEGRDFRLLEAVARAEGIPNKLVDTVIVCRRTKGSDERTLIKLSLRKATRSERENIRLMPGDIVSVEPTLITLIKDSAGYVGVAACC